MATPFQNNYPMGYSQQMMNSGVVSQEQYNAAVQNAEKFRSTFGGR